MVSHTCPSCGGGEIATFYEVEQVPVHSVLLLPTREEAVNYPVGDIRLGFCETCGFIFNTVFDPSAHEYSARYESTQGFSATFNAFAYGLAKALVERHDLRGKHIIEIGCGQGEFLTLLCELGGNTGIGFDPAYVEARSERERVARVTFVKEFYTEQHAGCRGDFICCKMTLEHIQHTAEFVSMVRRSIGDRMDTVVFFQVPNVTRILRELAFWDIYYEHCSYFDRGSLVRLFRRCGFDPIHLATDYEDQYLMIEARPGNGTGPGLAEPADDVRALKEEVLSFQARYPHQICTWQEKLAGIGTGERRAVIWGAGSKGVAFLTTLGVHDQIAYAVDINPYKQGYYMAGTGQEVVASSFLQAYRPHVVIVMNPIYVDEIGRELKRMGVAAELIPIAPRLRRR